MLFILLVTPTRCNFLWRVQNFVKAKKTLQKDALEKFVGLDEVKVEAFFRGSVVHKLNFEGKLADQDITDVVTYVVDQAKNEKW